MAKMDYGAVVDRGPWPEAIVREFERAGDNGCVGTRLISETERVRVWEIRLKPGERIGFHRHVLDYFWTAVTAGRGRSRMQDGTTVEKSYFAGETQHESYGAGELRSTTSRTPARPSSSSPPSSSSTAPTPPCRCRARSAPRRRNAQVDPPPSGVATGEGGHRARSGGRRGQA